MAYKPSLRRTSVIAGKPGDPAVINLMVCLIPLLLAGSVWTKLAIKQLNLPPKTAGGPGTAEMEKPVEIEKRLGLNVIISKEGFFIGSASGFLQIGTQEQTEGAPPTIPLLADGSLDYKGLQQK